MTVDAPFLGICAAVHMQELMGALGVEDPLGLRERLLVIYERPRFVRSAQFQHACSQIPADTLHKFLAQHFWQLHCIHHPGHPPVERFVSDLNYKWIHYRWSPEAASLFWDNFDDRTSEQEAAYRVDQQAAKKAGKWKTRHFRLALPMRNLMQAAARTTAGDWIFDVSPAAAKASVLFSSWMDDVFERLDMLRAIGVPDPPPIPYPRPAAPPADSLTPDAFRALLALSHIPEVLAPDLSLNVAHLRAIMLAVLVSTRRPIFRQTEVAHLRPVVGLGLPEPSLAHHALRALKVLQLLGCGVFTLSCNDRGSKVCWFTKCSREDWEHEALLPCKNALELPEDFAFCSWPRQQLQQSKQKGQAAITFPDFSDAPTVVALASAAASWTEAYAPGN